MRKWCLWTLILVNCVTDKPITEAEYDNLRCRSFAMRICSTSVGTCFQYAVHQCRGLIKDIRLEEEIKCQPK